MFCGTEQLCCALGKVCVESDRWPRVVQGLVFSLRAAIAFILENIRRSLFSSLFIYIPCFTILPPSRLPCSNFHHTTRMNYGKICMSFHSKCFAHSHYLFEHGPALQRSVSNRLARLNQLSANIENVCAHSIFSTSCTNNNNAPHTYRYACIHVITRVVELSGT